ncbi:cellulase CEL7A [Mycena pura]|uniref:Glucanase n=1 Tax=Mycena pura TaxID=153505 RepID=A0AAD6UJU2_9AGAR|nr:cellulase CEL7A [Mycena pura]
MSRSNFLVLAALLPVALSQLAGTNIAENHPALTWQKCTGTGGTSCTTQQSSIVIDANWRWTHQGVSGTTNCYTGNTWDTSICTSGVACAQACAIDGADYEGTYGITTSGNALTLKFVTVSEQPNIGSRVYLLAPGSTTEYQTFNFNNQEFSFKPIDGGLALNYCRFDVDVSQLPCGLNGALYFSQMDADGGVAKSNGNNKAGVKYGTGWVPDSNDPNSGMGLMGTCCPEMDVWEANSVSSAFTPHTCTTLDKVLALGPPALSRTRTCDQAGCDFNSFRMGDTSFYGPGLTVDTTQKFTVVTQFVGNPMTSIQRLYVQNGKVIANSNSTIPGVTGNAISDSFCAAQKTAFGDTNTFASKGGMSTMSKAASAGMVLVMSLWDDHARGDALVPLDAPYPPTKSPSAAGVTRGTCSPSSGVPATVEAQSPNAQVVYSNIRFGDIGSTFSTTGGTTGGGGGTTPPASAPTGGTVAEFGQCGGENYTGATVCVSPFTCQELNPFFFQCLTA